MKKDEFILALKQALITQNTSDIEEIISDFEDHFAAALQEGKTEEEITETLGHPALIAEQYPAAMTSAGQPLLSDSQAFAQPPVPDSSQHFASDSPISGQAPVSGQQPKAANTKNDKTKTVQSGTGQPKTPGQSADKAKQASIASADSVYHADNSPKYVRAEDNINTAAPVLAVTPVEPAGNSQAGQHNLQAESPAKIDSGKVIALVFINMFIMLPLVFTIFGILIGFWSASIGVGVGGAALFAVAVLQQGVQVQILILFGISLTAFCLLMFIASYYLTKASILGLIRYIRWNGTWVKEK